VAKQVDARLRARALGRRRRVLGRVVPRTFDGAIGWLEHEEGQDFITLKKKLLSPVPPWQNIRVGQVLQVNNEPFFVTEKARAVITAWEGQLPFPVRGGEEALFVDGNINGQIASLEYAHDSIEFGIGHAVERGDLNFQIPSL
jgi:hypothetical protein